MVYSRSISRRTVSIKLSVIHWLLPLLVLNVMFTSKPGFLDALLAQLFSLLFMLSAGFVFYRSVANRTLAIGVPSILFFFRILRYIYGDEGLELILYFVPYSIILVTVSARMVRDYSPLLLRQMVWICVLSAALSLMQIFGVHWAQSLTNFYWSTGGSSEQYLFVTWSDLPNIAGIQSRPVGFASANNIVSQYMIIFYAFTIGWIAWERSPRRLRWISVFIISCACALSGAKLVVVGIIITHSIAWIVSKTENRLRVFWIFTAPLGAYGLYWILFPGLFVRNYNLDLLAFNLMIRIADLDARVAMPWVDGAVAFLSRFNTGVYVGDRQVLEALERSEGTTISGIGSVIEHWELLLAGLALVALVWVMRVGRVTAGPDADRRGVAVVVVVGMFVGAMGGPFLFTSYFWFFAGFGLYPVAVALLRVRKPTGKAMSGPEKTAVGIAT